MTTPTPVTITPRPPKQDTRTPFEVQYGEDINVSVSRYADASVGIDLVRYRGEVKVRLRMLGEGHSASALLTASQLRELAQDCIDAAHDLEGSNG